jgi:PHD/YefM family antitoxin component YafN of YafNO toxin-antitoxin module
MSNLCHAKREPIFITKNGYGDMVLMSIEAYDELIESAATDAAIREAEEEFSENGKLFDARAELRALRKKYLG